MKKVRQFISLYWQTLLGAFLILTIVTGLLGYKLGAVVPALSNTEVVFVSSSSSIDKIVADPLNLFMKLPMFALQYFDHATPTTLRAVGAFFGVVTVLLFYFVLRKWHTRRAALLTSFLFIVSSWFLQISRLALPYILLAFGVISLIAIAGFIIDKNTKRYMLLLSLVALTLLVYIPGMLWLISIVGIWQLPNIRRVAKNTAVLHKVFLFFLVALILLPLTRALYLAPDLVNELLVLPKEFIPLEWIRRILVLPIFLTAQGPQEPVYNLGRLPLLDVFTTVLVVLGIYSYYFKAKLQRTQLILVLTIVSVVIIALNGPTFIPLLLPLAFIVAGAGLTLLLQQWFTVFPRNPIARSLGVITIAAVIAITGMYHVRRYFIAWSGNPDTRNEFIYLLDE